MKANKLNGFGMRVASISKSGVWLAALLMFMLGSSARAARLTLGQCLATAVKNSYGVEQSALDLHSAQLGVWSAAAPFYPQASLSGSQILGGYSKSGLRLENPPVWSTDTYSASGSINWNLFNSFHDWEGLEIARLGESQATETERDTIQNLALSVVEAYYNLLKQEKIRDVNDQVLRDRQDRLSYTQSLYKQGVSSYSDVVNATTQVKEAKLTLFNIKSQVVQAQTQLNYLMGMPLDRDTDGVDDTGRNDSVPLELESLQTARRYRPDLRRLREGAVSSEHSLLLSQLNNWPVLRVDASYSQYLDRYGLPMDQWSNLYRGDQNGSWNLIASVQYSFFQGFAGNASVESSQNSLDRSRLALAQAERDVARDVRSVCLDLAQNLAAIGLNADLVKTARENLQQAQAKYERGNASFFEVTDAETQVLQALTSQANSVYDYKINRARWRKTVGLDLVSGEGL